MRSFRAWDRVQKEYVYYDIENGKIVHFNLHPFISEDQNRENDEMSTGVEDQNGKAIWEGDIIRRGPDLSQYGLENQYQEVVFEDGCFVGKQQGGIGLGTGAIGIKFVLSAFAKEITVVGTKYKDPELYKQIKE